MANKIFDFKKEYKDLYSPKSEPGLIDIPSINFFMVDGTGDPNNNREFEKAIESLYSLSYIIKMSYKKGQEPKNFYEYVVPPLEGLWWVEEGIFSLEQRDNWKWTIMIRQPDFVTRDVFEWACDQAKKKKTQKDIEKVYFDSFEEGQSVQIMHIGPYSTETETVKKIDRFICENGLISRLGSGGKHHEIYLSDPRKGSQNNMKTVLRHPVRYGEKSVSIENN